MGRCCRTESSAVHRRERYAVGIDLGGTNLKAGLVAENGKAISLMRVATSGDGRVIPQIIQAVRKTIRRSGVDFSRIVGVGIGTPGIVENKKGILLSQTNIRGWEKIKIKKEIEKILPFPVYADNDVNLITLAELRYGAGKGKRNLVCLTLGTGVGGAIVVDGKVYHGNGFRAGEIGRMVVGSPGGVDYVEDHIGREGIIERARELLKTEKDSLIAKLVNGDLNSITPETIYKAAVKGDLLAKRIWGEFGFYLGFTLTNVINFFNPEMVIIGGRVSEARKFFSQSLMKIVKDKSFNLFNNKAEIAFSKLGEKAGVLGAGMIAWRNSGWER